MVVATMDSKGRIAIPAEIRTKYGYKSGDAFFFDAEENDVIRMAKAENPFDVLADQALEEQGAGHTRSLRAYAAEKGINLDAERSVRS